MIPDRNPAKLSIIVPAFNEEAYLGPTLDSRTSEPSEMSRAGLGLAKEVARIYSGDPRVLAVMAGGSVSRGCADEYSDVEIGVFWDTPPSDADRRDAARRMGGDVWKFDPSGGPRASEHIGLSEATVGSVRYRGTAMVSPVHMTVDMAEEWIGDLIDDLDTAPQKYELAAAVRYGVPLYGHDQVGRWKDKAASFPERLALKLVQQNLWLGPWFNRAAYVARGDHLVAAQQLVWMQQGIVNVLAALNREYLPSVEHKWVDWLLERLEIKPDRCADRLRGTFATGDLGEAVRDLVELGMEVIDLVEEHLPEVDETPLFEDHPWVTTSWARQRWTEYPAYTLIANIARGEEQARGSS